MHGRVENNSHPTGDLRVISSPYQYAALDTLTVSLDKAAIGLIVDGLQRQTI